MVNQVCLPSMQNFRTFTNVTTKNVKFCVDVTFDDIYFPLSFPLKDTISFKYRTIS